MSQASESLFYAGAQDAAEAGTCLIGARLLRDVKPALHTLSAPAGK